MPSRAELGDRSQRGVRLADQGYFWVGVNYTERDGEQVVDGSQLYVEFQIPEVQTHTYPVVLIHGGGGQSLDWVSTPDGRPGWRTLLLQQGYAVYTVDRPSHGRSPVRAAAGQSNVPVPSVEAVGALFAGAHNPNHTQWPGTGLADDPALGQLLASQSPMPDVAMDHDVMRRRGAELLDRIGPAIIITSSAGGPAGWLMACERPNLVRAVVALEPLGPSGPVELPWGLAASPVPYDPPVQDAGDLDFVTVEPANGQPGMKLQSEPPRHIPALKNLPVAVVTSEQSFASASDAGTVAFLRQAGCRQVHQIELGELGILGNGHLMMIERNHDRVLEVILRWLDEHAVAI